MKKLKEIMREGVLFGMQKDATVSEAAGTMVENNIGMVLVLEGERLIGVLSERDIVRRIVQPRRDPQKVRIGEVMTTDLVVAEETEDYQAAMRKMDGASVRHLPVVRGDRVVAMLSIRDLMHVHMESMGEEIRSMREYLYFVPPEVVHTREKS